MQHFVQQMIEMFRLELFLQLSLATLFGGAIGLERELGGKPAGLRTNILICIGSVLYTKLSITMASGNSDPTRVAAQIVTGVGFIGAGTILHARGAVVGLTSAATIWVVAAIGVALGAAFYWEAAGTTLLVLLVLHRGVTRRLVVDLASRRVAWRIPPLAVQAIRDALGAGWAVVQVEAPAMSDGDGGSGTEAALAAARGAEIYLGYGVSAGVVQAARGTLKWAHTSTAGVGASVPHVRGTGVVLTNSAGVHADPIADWTIAAIGYFARGLDRMREFQAEEHWAQPEITGLEIPVREFGELRVGVYGLGGIGTAVARRPLALGVSVAGVRRRPERGGPPGGGRVGVPGRVGRLRAGSDG